MSFASNNAEAAFVARVAALELAMLNAINVPANPILVARNVVNTANLLAQTARRPARSPLRQVLSLTAESRGMDGIRAPMMKRSYATRGPCARPVSSPVLSMAGVRAPSTTRSHVIIGLGLDLRKPPIKRDLPIQEETISPDSQVQESQAKALNPAAPEFLPSAAVKARELNPAAPEFVPAASKATAALNPTAPEFVPSASKVTTALGPTAPAFIPRPTTAKVFKLNPATPEFIPATKVFKFNPAAMEFIPRQGATKVFNFDPAAPEFIPGRPKVFKLDPTSPEFIPRKVDTAPVARKKVVPTITDEMWDCVEFMDLLESCESFEELKALKQPDESISGLSPLAPEFVPRWTHTSAYSPSQESQEELCAIPISRSFATIGTREIELWARRVSQELEESRAIPTSSFGNKGPSSPRSPLIPHSPALSEHSSLMDEWAPDDYVDSPVSEFEFSSLPRSRFESYTSSTSESERSVQYDVGSPVAVQSLTYQTARSKFGFWIQAVVVLFGMLLLLGGLGNY